MPRVSDGGGRVALGISSPLTCGGEQQAGGEQQCHSVCGGGPRPLAACQRVCRHHTITSHNMSQASLLEKAKPVFGVSGFCFWVTQWPAPTWTTSLAVGLVMSTTSCLHGYRATLELACL